MTTLLRRCRGARRLVVVLPEHEELRFHLEAGLLEGRPRPEGPSLLEANRHLRDVLQAKGYAVEYREFNGGHSVLSWRDALADGLLSLLATPSKP